MSNFMANYEDVNARIKRFRVAFPNCRVLTDVVNFQPENGWILVKASIWKDATKEGLPDAVDYAFGDRETYPQNMKKWFVEDTSTSAIGRCISLILDVDHKATAQNMARVERPKVERLTVEQIKVQDPNDVWSTTTKEMPKPLDSDAIAASLGGEIIDETYNCKHGPMTLKEGTKKNGEAYRGFTCKHSGVGPGEVDPSCEPIWFNLTSSGKWAKQEKRAK